MKIAKFIFPLFAIWFGVVALGMYISQDNESFVWDYGIWIGALGVALFAGFVWSAADKNWHDYKVSFALFVISISCILLDFTMSWGIDEFYNGSYQHDPITTQTYINLIFWWLGTSSIIIGIGNLLVALWEKYTAKTPSVQ